MSLDNLPIQTASLLLRPFVPADARDTFVLSNEEAFRAWLPSQVYGNEPEALAVLEFLIGQYASPADPRLGPFVLAVEQAADQALIGHVGFSPFEGEVEIGFAIAQRCQGQGLAREAAVAASRWALGTFGLERILGITAAANLASRRVLARAGFAHQEDRAMRFQGVEQPVCVYTLAALAGPAPGS